MALVSGSLLMLTYDVAPTRPLPSTIASRNWEIDAYNISVRNTRLAIFSGEVGLAAAGIPSNTAVVGHVSKH